MAKKGSGLALEDTAPPPTIAVLANGCPSRFERRFTTPTCVCMLFCPRVLPNLRCIGRFLVLASVVFYQSVLADEFGAGPKDEPIDNIRVQKARLRVRVSRLKNGHAKVSNEWLRYTLCSQFPLVVANPAAQRDLGNKQTALPAAAQRDLHDSTASS